MSMNTIPEVTCKENCIKIYKPSIERTVIDASGNPLNIVGEATLYACLDIFSGKAKQITGLVLRGNTLDKEILLSRDQLIKWRILHCGFPTQAIDDFVKDVLKSKIKVIKNYPDIKTTEKQLENPPTSSKNHKMK